MISANKSSKKQLVARVFIDQFVLLLALLDEESMAFCLLSELVGDLNLTLITSDYAKYNARQVAQDKDIAVNINEREKRIYKDIDIIRSSFESQMGFANSSPSAEINIMDGKSSRCPSILTIKPEYYSHIASQIVIKELSIFIQQVIKTH